MYQSPERLGGAEKNELESIVEVHRHKNELNKYKKKHSFIPATSIIYKHAGTNYTINKKKTKKTEYSVLDRCACFSFGYLHGSNVQVCGLVWWRSVFTSVGLCLSPL